MPGLPQMPEGMRQRRPDFRRGGAQDDRQSGQLRGCGRCLGACNFDAIQFNNDNANEILNCKMAEYTKAVVDGRPNFHISLIVDVSPNCDCHCEMTRRSFPTRHVCLPSIRWLWIRHAWTPAWRRLPCPTVSWPITGRPQFSRPITTISPTLLPSPNGVPVWSMPKNRPGQQRIRINQDVTAKCSRRANPRPRFHMPGGDFLYLEGFIKIC